MSVSADILEGVAGKVTQAGAGSPREQLAAVLGISRQSLWRYTAHPPAWLLFALLGVAQTGGDRAAALRRLLEQLEAGR